MLVEHRGRRPTVHESAWVAPTAVVCGDVYVGEDAHVNGAREAFVATRAALFPAPTSAHEPSCGSAQSCT
jgi:carbonic anhydrase/acetyltransferase-like protein (isoleucine patch superfamily)